MKDHVAQEIRRLRRDRGLTQEELSERANVSQKFLSEMERARANPSLSVMSRVSNALGVSLAEFFAGGPLHGKKASPPPRNWGLYQRVEKLLNGLDPRVQNRILQAMRVVRATLEGR